MELLLHAQVEAAKKTPVNHEINLWESQADTEVQAVNESPEKLNDEEEEGEMKEDHTDLIQCRIWNLSLEAFFCIGNTVKKRSTPQELADAVSTLRDMRKINYQKLRATNWRRAFKDSGLCRTIQTIINPDRREEIHFPDIQASYATFNWRSFLGHIHYMATPEEHHLVRKDNIGGAARIDVEAVLRAMTDPRFVLSMRHHCQQIFFAHSKDNFIAEWARWMLPTLTSMNLSWPIPPEQWNVEQLFRDIGRLKFDTYKLADAGAGSNELWFVLLAAQQEREHIKKMNRMWSRPKGEGPSGQAPASGSSKPSHIHALPYSEKGTELTGPCDHCRLLREEEQCVRRIPVTRRGANEVNTWTDSIFTEAEKHDRMQVPGKKTFSPIQLGFRCIAHRPETFSRCGKDVSIMVNNGQSVGGVQFRPWDSDTLDDMRASHSLVSNTLIAWIYIAMARRLRWQSQIGRDTIQKIVTKVIPTWKNGLRPVQEDLVSAILDGDDVLCCTATGDGKSAAFSVPILVLNDYNLNPALYPAGLPTRATPVGIVVTPTKGLAANIVLELQRLNVTAFAYCRESLADARRLGVKLADEIKACDTWQVICVDPEHLKTKEWREISESPVFRARILFAAVDEAHLINEWGVDFRLPFRIIGLFLRGRLPASTSILGLSATLEPGTATKAVCQSLGLFDGQFHMIRRTNERPNVQFSMQTLSHGLAGYEFPDLLPFLTSGRKIIIHFHSINLLFRCYVYIWSLQSPSADKMRRTRMYHSLCPAAYNEDTIRRIEEDPQCQIILATIAFANGINAPSLLDSVTLGFSSTLDIMWQEKGRVGRDPETIARGVVLIQKSTIKAAQKVVDSSSAPAAPRAKKGTRSTKKAEPMSLQKALFILEKVCYIAFLNRHYTNPPSETSFLDCITAERSRPCCLCVERANGTLDLPTPATASTLPALTPPEPLSVPRSAAPKKLKLTQKERDSAIGSLKKFRRSLRLQYHDQGRLLDHPEIMFLSPSLQISILDKLLSMSSLSDFQSVVDTWRHRENHATALYEVIIGIQTKIQKKRDAVRLARNEAARQRRLKRKRDEVEESTDEEPEDEECDEESDSSLPETVPLPPPRSQRPPRNPGASSGPRKRPVLNAVTNTRAGRALLLSAAETAQEYRRQYKPRQRG
ncbi:hypothetical protein B0H16DRAFT_1838657 [Mycena metata]|uniref:DNA 3'-5' helicase n=1 Tax=Mycena metata TaxID=1033252 RepID=A0AAD7NXN0_9AGAR|nr:hypothetical protein B0H16DRAFT_1838657 [Mycena metata]